MSPIAYSSHRSQHGVTLLEMLVVIAIAAILMSVAVPSFTGTTQRFRALGEANGFVRDLQFARSEAIKQGLPVTVCTSSDGATCQNSNIWHTGWIIFSDPGANKTIGTILRVQKGWAGTDTFTSDNSTSAITFSRDGFTIALPGSGAVTFTLHTEPANSYATQCVSIIKTGRLELQSTGTEACK